MEQERIPEVDPQMYGQLIFGKGAKGNLIKKENSIQQW